MKNVSVEKLQSQKVRETENIEIRSNLDIGNATVIDRPVTTSMWLGELTIAMTAIGKETGQGTDTTVVEMTGNGHETRDGDDIIATSERTEFMIVIVTANWTVRGIMDETKIGNKEVCMTDRGIGMTGPGMTADTGTDTRGNLKLTPIDQVISFIISVL